MSAVTVLRSLFLAVVALAAAIGLIALCNHVAGGPDAWKVGLMLVATLPLVAFATRERR